MEKLVILKKAYEKRVADNIRAILGKNNIFHKISFARNNIESLYGAQNSNQIEIRIEEKNFQTAFELIEKINEYSDDKIELNSYSDDEIIEIILNPSDWHRSFVLEAKKIVTERGIQINENEISDNEKEKLEKIKLGISPKKFIYYFFWFLAVVGGYIGLIAGYYYWRGKLKAFDGNRYFMYNKRTRFYGKWMFITGILSAVGLIIFLVAR